MTFCRRLKLFGNDYVMVEGAITTESAFLAGELSFAHLFPDGKIRCLGRVIADADDIDWLPISADLVPEASEFFGGLFGETWNWPREE